MNGKDILIRGVNVGVAEELKTRARKRGISLNEYCRQLFINESQSEATTEVEQRYTNLVQVVAGALNTNTKTLKDLVERIDDLEYYLKHK